MKASKPKRTLRTRAASKPKKLSLVIPELEPALSRPQKILVPIDFSEPSLKAVRHGVQLARQSGGSLVLVHVAETKIDPLDFLIVPAAMEDANVRILHAARERISALAADVRDKYHVNTEFIVRQGNPFEEIAKVARTINADLIAISTHGYTGLKHVYMGSVAERVVRFAPCPVLVLR